MNTLDKRTHMKSGKRALLIQPVLIVSDADRCSSTGRTRTDGWADPAPAAPTHTAAHHPLPLGQIMRKFTTTPGVY